MTKLNRHCKKELKLKFMANLLKIVKITLSIIGFGIIEN